MIVVRRERSAWNLHHKIQKDLLDSKTSSTKFNVLIAVIETHDADNELKELNCPAPPP
jgi:hypothetical protein